MSNSTTGEIQSTPVSAVDWEPPVPPTNLIFDDGEPLESNRHRIAMNALIRSMLVAMANRRNYFVGGNMFIYYSSQQIRNRDFRGPDFFVVLNVDGESEREGWVVWEENGRYPDVIIELMSPSTAAIDIGVKKDIYEQTFRTPDYYVFNPFEPESLQGWRLDWERGYQELNPNPQGWLWCQRLGLWLGTWEGTIEDKPGIWLRFYDQQGNLVLLPEEAAFREGALQQLLRLLAVRFGQVPVEVETRLRTQDIHQLEGLVEVVLEVESLEEFINQLS
ncbi:Uma2 family endonuclease [Coleofasciculus chthonoplastes]|uniref:Uma2 family endonuclease n=1 Tax=Coleofasciculus chthonoplastes TaxID=64178 RepID=UPI0032FE0CBC